MNKYSNYIIRITIIMAVLVSIIISKDTNTIYIDKISNCISFEKLDIQNHFSVNCFFCDGQIGNSNMAHQNSDDQNEEDTNFENDFFIPTTIKNSNIFFTQIRINSLSKSSNWENIITDPNSLPPAV